MGGQAESTRGQRAAPSGSMSADYKLVGGVWARAAHEAFALRFLHQILLSLGTESGKQNP